MADYICEQCGASFDTSRDSCPECGWEGERKRCAVCGSLYHVWRDLCPGCGGVNAERVAAPKDAGPEDHAFRASAGSSVDWEQCEERMVTVFTELAKLEALMGGQCTPEAVGHCKTLREWAFSLLFTVRAIQQERNFSNIVKVGVIGEFSAGKSSFINSLLRLGVCPTGDEATTSAVTRFSHIPDLFAIHRMNEEWDLGEEIEHGEYLRLARHGESGNESFYFACFLDAPELDGIALYDTPGFNNANSRKGSRDTELTEKVLGDMDVILYVVDINTGSLGDYGLERLRPFKEKGTPVYLILNKEDEKAPSRREAILAQCREEFEDFEDALSYSATREMDFVAYDENWDNDEDDATEKPLIFTEVQIDGEKRMALAFAKGVEEEDGFLEAMKKICDPTEGGYQLTLKSAPALRGAPALRLSRIKRGLSPKRAALFGWLEQIRANKEVFARRELAGDIADFKETAEEFLDNGWDWLDEEFQSRNEWEIDALYKEARELLAPDSSLYKELWSLCQREITNFFDTYCPLYKVTYENGTCGWYCPPSLSDPVKALRDTVDRIWKTGSQNFLATVTPLLAGLDENYAKALEANIDRCLTGDDPFFEEPKANMLNFWTPVLEWDDVKKGFLQDNTFSWVERSDALKRKDNWLKDIIAGDNITNTLSNLVERLNGVLENENKFRIRFQHENEVQARNKAALKTQLEATRESMEAL